MGFNSAFKGLIAGHLFFSYSQTADNSRWNFSHVSFTDWSFTRDFFLQMPPASPNNCYNLQIHSAGNFFCTLTTEFSSWYQSAQLALCTWGAILQNWSVCAIYNLILITTWIIFSYCATDIATNITLKSPTFHVHALYIKIHLMQNKMCYY